MLRDAVLRGELPAGQRLNERSIARQMGISRVPVRKAIQRLEYEGLVISTPNRGSFVRYFDEQDIKEIFELRAVLEGLACQRTVVDRKLEPADFEELRGSIEDQQEAVAAKDYDRWVESEIQFHTFILTRAGSRRLLNMWQNLHVQCLFATRENWEPYLRAYGSHPVILDALLKGDPDPFIPLHQDIYAKVRDHALRLMHSGREPEPEPDVS